MNIDIQKLSDITKDIKDLCVKHNISALMFPDLINKDHPEYIKLKDDILMNFFLVDLGDDMNGKLLTPSDLVEPSQFKFFQDFNIDKLYYISKIGKNDDARHNRLSVGYSSKGVINNVPTVGECFYIGGFNSMRTSTVTELLDDEIDYFTFRTMNSIYKLTKV
jgi:hypothetical protein